MKRSIFCFVILLILLIVPMNIFAEEKTSKKCSYLKLSDLNKLAAKVEFSYDIVYDENGTPKIKFTLYNLTEELYVTIDDGENEGFYKTVYNDELVDSLYFFEDTDVTTIKTYRVVIMGKSEECNKTLRTIRVTKPKKNKFHDYNECKFNKTEDYVYCAEWITRDFNLRDSEILEKINERRTITVRTTTITTECKTCIAEKERQKKINRYNELKTFFVVGLSIGILLDMIFIYYKISTLRRSRL